MGTQVETCVPIEHSSIFGRMNMGAQVRGFFPSENLPFGRMENGGASVRVFLI